MNLVQMGVQLQDGLDSRQVDSQVALEAEDGPESADLGGLVADHRPLAPGADQASGLVADQQPGRNREMLGHLLSGDDRRSHGWAGSPGLSSEAIQKRCS